MKNKLNFSVILVCMLALTLVFISCNRKSGGSGVYKLQWGAFWTSYSEVQNTIAEKGWNVITAGTNAAVTKGADATSVYNFCIKNIFFIDGDDGIEGSFEDLLNYSKNGVSAPEELKTLLKRNKTKVPLAGVFDAGSSAVVFYITKN
jgi:hypothetical protein